jgi:tRNA A37 threonylcarbamoyladenosine dehydratase
VIADIIHSSNKTKKGVGSHAAHMLLRSGVGRLRLIDFDQVTLSSLNRHAVATRADVGTSKAACLARHFAAIMPEARVEAVGAMFTAEAAAELLEGAPDFVLDAIDNIDTKAALLAACKDRGIPVLCSAGAGAKADPTRVRFVDISESSIDPLARAVRHKLGRAYGIRGGVPVLMSTEKQRCELVATEEMEAGNPLDFQIVPNFRVRTIPVLGPTPALFGMAAAGYILCALAGAPLDGTTTPVLRLTPAQVQRALDRLIAREEAAYGTDEGVEVDASDVSYLLHELWRGFSARAERVVPPGGNRGLSRCTADLTLVRWDASRPARVDNLVLLTLAEADAHEALGLQGSGLDELRAKEPKFVAFVEGVLARARLEYCGVGWGEQQAAARAAAAGEEQQRRRGA